MAKLKPCPSCGHDPTLKESAFRSPLAMHSPMYYAICSNPDCPSQIITGVHATEEQAIAEWNRKVNKDNKLNFDYYVSDAEIREWMDAEIVRLGELFKGFEITWYQCDDFVFAVEVWSETKNPSLRLNEPHGRHLVVGRVQDRYGYDCISVLQREGRKLYHLLNKDYPVHRDLGRKK